MQRIEHKRGDTFVVAARLTDDGVPIDLTGWGVRAHVRDGEALVNELVYTPIVLGDGQYTLTCTAANTTTWPVKTLYCDIEYTSPSSVVASTETFAIVLKKDITI